MNVGNRCVLLGLALAAVGVSAILSTPALADDADPPHTLPSMEPGPSDPPVTDPPVEPEPEPPIETSPPPSTSPTPTPTPSAEIKARVSAVHPLFTPRLVGAVSLGRRHYAFVRLADSKVYFRDLTAGPGAFSWAKGTGSTRTGPSVTTLRNNPGVTHLAGTDPGGAAMHSAPKDPSLTSWSEWQSQGGKFTSPVSVVENTDDFGTGGPVTFGRGTDGAVYAIHRGRSIRLNGVATSPPLVSATNHDPVITIRGTDGRLYSATGDADSGYSAFRPVGSAKVTSSASVTARGGRYYYRGEDGALWFMNTGANGSPAFRVGGAITSTPIALDQKIIDQPERAWIMARGTDGHLYVYDNGAKTWRNFGGNLA